MMKCVTLNRKNISRTPLVSPLSFSTTGVEMNKFTDSKPIDFGGGFKFLMEIRKIQEGKAIYRGNNFHKVNRTGLRIMKNS